ncbi:MBL fold metallo-hydrolase [Pontibacter anaerobius]|uniref:MBL fold metallo-hydrolase n=1 Tax=Pontibacter anaerobius TaxID=2993940 RepID=A0ABT3RGA7_9BACT|nr:MBL fold metallo-hydrolase [Pontibacter anaerobius]MCX2740864.1 MBL fold metallo-hydrolase [Pontibacter anaerobius]
MQLSITSLNSGSNGNCYYIGNDREAVLVDAGISCRETEKRMKRLGLSMGKVKAIFVSHEHADHIRGLPVLARKYNLPVYITPGTLHNSRLDLSGVQVLHFQAHEAVQVGRISVLAFPKLHDARDPHSFVVSCQEVRIGVFTDIGAPCDQVIAHFQLCHAVFLEANYDEGMLEKGRYPYYLKNRIRGGHGHLSNRQALSLYTAYKPPFMSHVLLSHLSKDNNCPKLVEALFRLHADGAEVVVASRFEETPVYTISNLPVAPKRSIGRQISLFDAVVE